MAPVPPSPPLLESLAAVFDWACGIISTTRFFFDVYKGKIDNPTCLYDDFRGRASSTVYQHLQGMPMHAVTVAHANRPDVILANMVQIAKEVMEDRRSS